jgi:diguanylate cyclase (GGDEF)-like protein
VARGYRWLSGAALFWCAGIVMQLAMAGSLGSSSGPPSLADVAPLLALAATAVGIMVLASPSSTEADAAGARGPILPVSVLPGLADGYVTAVSLLVMGWVLAFGAEYHASNGGPGTFLLDLLHPLADLAVLGALLPVLTVAWRRTLLPYLSLLAATGADSLGVGARVFGGHEGILQQLALIAAAVLLGLSPWTGMLAARYLPGLWSGDTDSQATASGARDMDPVPGPGSGTGGGMATIIAAIMAAIAAFVVIIHGLAGAPASGLALVIAGGAAVLVVAVRILMLVRETGVAHRMWRQSGGSLQDLASRISDMTLICDFDGTIWQVSSLGGFSYPQAMLVGRRLGEFVHPEDIPVARYVIQRTLGLPRDIDPVSLPDAAAEEAFSPSDAAEAQAAAGRFPCRVRAADGTWRHVECAVLLYQVPGEPARMLVTVRDISDEVALRNQVAHLTFHDGLTGLPNRAYLEDRVRAVLTEPVLAEPVPAETVAAEAVAAETVPAETVAVEAVQEEEVPSGGAPAEQAPATLAGVIFLDLDGFTGVNDSAGHGAGDLVLAQAARRLRAVVPARNPVARWGGDEFAVLVEKPAGVAEVTELAERVAQAIAEEPFKVNDQEIGLTASVGAAMANAGEKSPDLLLRNADVAMSRAKASGGDRVEVYAEHMHADVARRMQLASDLKRAIDRDELTLVYQPIVELATSRVIGAEALVRWHLDREEIAPREFLAVADDSGLSGPLGEWVLRTAAGQGARWRSEGWDIFVAVNLSPRQLAAQKFPAELAGVLADAGLAPSSLAVEVNERILVEGADEVVSRLTELRELGVRLAIDDFGTGYASLAYLRELPVDIIKIDPSFVSGLGGDPTLTLLTRTIAQVGRDLGIEVIAEGIEHPRQLAELKEMGCTYGQGFLLARPLPAAGVDAMLQSAAPQPPVARVSKAGAA